MAAQSARDDSLLPTELRSLATLGISLAENELHLDFIRSSGPGGQNVNKVATAVRLTFDVRHSRSIPDDVKERLLALAGNRAMDAGVIRIVARRFRTQGGNRKDAMSRLVSLIRRAAVPPKPRRRTRPTAASKARRLDEKRRASVRKRERRAPHGDSD